MYIIDSLPDLGHGDLSPEAKEKMSWILQRLHRTFRYEMVKVRNITSHALNTSNGFVIGAGQEAEVTKDMYEANRDVLQVVPWTRKDVRRVEDE